MKFNPLTHSSHKLVYVAVKGSRFWLGFIHQIEVVVAHQVVFGIACDVDSLRTTRRNMITDLQQEVHGEDNVWICITVACTVFKPLTPSTGQLGAAERGCIVLGLISLLEVRFYLAFVFPKSQRHQLKRKMCLDESRRVHFVQKIKT